MNGIKNRAQRAGRAFFALCSLLLLVLPSAQAAASGSAQQAITPAAQAATPAAQAAQTTASLAPAQGIPMHVHPEIAYALMRGEAEGGNVGAMLTLGQFYEQGVGVARNYTKALEWYEKAANAGQAAGFYNLGICYEFGMGATADMDKAIQNFQKAADMGMALAMQKLAAIFIAGNGVDRDVAKGLGLLESAANAGLAAAANDLGGIYLAGLLDQAKDEKKALSMFMQAANLGSLDAVRQVAAMHQDGIGTEADPAAAYRWYFTAQRGGHFGDDVARMLGQLEGSLSAAQVQQAQQEANAWLENFARRQAGAPQ